MYYLNVPSFTSKERRFITILLEIAADYHFLSCIMNAGSCHSSLKRISLS